MHTSIHYTDMKEYRHTHTHTHTHKNVYITQINTGMCILYRHTQECIHYTDRHRNVYTIQTQECVHFIDIHRNVYTIQTQTTGFVC